MSVTRRHTKSGKTLSGAKTFGKVIESILLSFVFVAILLWIMNYNPIRVYSALLRGSLGSMYAISETLLSTTPLLFAGLAFALAFRGSLFNIGVEGQLVLGALAAGFVGYTLNGFPSVVHIPLALIAAMAAGGFWGAIPGYLKAKVGAHEVIVTIMLNYIAFNLSAFLLTGLMKGTDNLPACPPLAESAQLPTLIGGTRLSISILIALFFAGVMWFILWKMRLGYRIRAVGLNPHAAHFAGIKSGKTIVTTMVLSGMIAGLAGAGEVLGLHHRVYNQFSPGYGFDAIAVALLGNSHPIGVVLSATLFGMLKTGAVEMQSTAGVSKEIVRIFQAVIIFFVITKVSVKSITYYLRKIVRRSSTKETAEVET